jgi:putative DNA primase/helicase
MPKDLHSLVPLADFKAILGLDDREDTLRWKQFIREIMDFKADVISFVQTAVGWALTGDISEQTISILFGNGANGKSTPTT